MSYYRRGVERHRHTFNIDDAKDRKSFIKAVAAKVKLSEETFAHLDDQIIKAADAVDEAVKAVDSKKAAPEPYIEDESGLIWLRPTPEGCVPTPLTNFFATIQADIVEDDGIEKRTMFEIETSVGNRRKTFVILASEFSTMTWPVAQLGARAIVCPGFGLRDHARAAIQVLSGNVPRRYIFTHSGWRKVRKQWVYLHAEGAIGQNGPVSSVGVSLSAALASFVLPPPPTGKKLAEAIRASLGILDVVADPISIPLLAGTYRAAVCSADYNVHITGPTGALKTELAALSQQHFGAGLDSRHLLGSWSSTVNSLEALAFTVKDAVLVVDDLRAGSKYDVSQMHRNADRLLRSQGNNSARADAK